jgi:CII-binding regulator of phage lambda lysogenization HflD
MKRQDPSSQQKGRTMGIFGDDDRQDQRLDALEAHVRVLTEAVRNNQADLTTCTIAVLALKDQIDRKVSAEDVDPAIAELNQQLRQARVELEQSNAAAEESWATLQTGVTESFETLRRSVQEAADRLLES